VLQKVSGFDPAILLPNPVSPLPIGPSTKTSELLLINFSSNPSLSTGIPVLSSHKASGNTLTISS